MSEAVTLREITRHNEDPVRALAVAPGQERFVASMSQSLDDASIQPGAPAPFYRSLGFEATGERFDGEEVYRLALYPPRWPSVVARVTFAKPR